ncbi:MAG: hypothetical protein ABGY72_03535 [bacterium]
MVGRGRQSLDDEPFLLEVAELEEADASELFVVFESPFCVFLVSVLVLFSSDDFPASEASVSDRPLFA